MSIQRPVRRLPPRRPLDKRPRPRCHLCAKGWHRHVVPAMSEAIVRANLIAPALAEAAS